MIEYEALLTGYPIYFATKEIQRRKHKKKRINKKWLKKYGCYEINSMPHGQVILMDDGIIYMTKKTYQELIQEKARKKNDIRKKKGYQ